VTDREPPFAGHPAKVRHARRRDLIFLAITAAVGSVIAVVDALTVAHDRAAAGRPVALWEPFVWDTTSVLVLTALTLGVMPLTRRATPLATPWGRTLFAHALGAVVFSLAHVTGMGILRWAVYAALGGNYAPLRPLSDFPYELRKDLVTYASLVAIYTVWLRLYPPPSDEPSETAIEVRDGARRHFVAVDDVIWIEAAGNYVELHRPGGPILHRAPLSELERRLAGQGFVRIHRSRLVRRAAVARVDSKPSGDFVVRLADGRELSGSRRYRRPLLEP
jgi:hypothetical protein